jgi:hypothetical protein
MLTGEAFLSFALFLYAKGGTKNAKGGTPNAKYAYCRFLR